MKRITSRKVHRLLSVVIGIQLLLWTVSGLIFSWNPISMVRGENTVQQPKSIDLANQQLIGLDKVLADPNVKGVNDKVTAVELRGMLGRPVYEVTTENAQSKKSQLLVNAISGRVISPISKATAEEIALNDFSEKADVLRSTLMTNPSGPHSEYRKKELPAWQVELDHPTGTIIYVSANRGTVVTRRNNRWRLFDFFWMLHTMDYQGRDNFNSWLLRIMSAMGVFSVLTGYWLWFRTRKRRKPRNR